MDRTGPSQGVGGLWNTHVPSLWPNPAGAVGPSSFPPRYELRQQGSTPAGSAPGQGWDAKLGSIQGWDAKLGSVLVAAVQQPNRHFCRQPAGCSTATCRAGAESPRMHPTLGAGAGRLLPHLPRFSPRRCPEEKRTASGAQPARNGQASKTPLAGASGRVAQLRFPSRVGSEWGTSSV